MKTKALLIIAASMALPLTQCTDKTPTAPAAENAASVVPQRAAAYGSLATIPADVEALISFNHFNELVQWLVAKQLVPAEAVTEDVTIWDGCAFAVSTKAVGTLEKLLPALKDIKVNVGAQQPLSPESAKALADAINSCGKIGPVYATITVNPGAEAKLAELYDKHMAELVRNKKVYAEYGGFKGVHINLVKDEHLAQLDPQLAEALKQRSVYIVSKVAGNTLQIVACEDVADIRFAATPEESVLGTDKLKAGDAHLGASNYVVSFGSQKLADLTNQMNSFSGQLDSLTPMLESLGESPEGAQVKEGMGKVLAELKKLDNTAPVKFADFLQVWNDGTIHLEARADARGCTFQPAKLIGAPHAANAAIYVEWTPGTDGSDFSMANLWDGVEQILPAVAGISPECSAYYAQYQQVKPVFQAFGKSFSTLGAGMGGSNAILVDGNGSMPSDKPEGTAIPRVLYASGVADRTQFAAAWAQFKDAAGQALTSFGQDASLVNMLPAQEVQEGNATVTSLVTPLNGPDLAPNVAISDQVIAFGSSPKQTAIVANSDVAAAESFAGMKFSLNMDAVDKLCSTISDLAGEPKVQSCSQKAAQYVKSVSGTVTTEGGECIIRIDYELK